MNFTNVHVCGSNSTFTEGNKASDNIIGRQILRRTCRLGTPRSCLLHSLFADCCCQDYLLERSCCDEAQTWALLARDRLSSHAHPSGVVFPAICRVAVLNIASGECWSENHWRRTKCDNIWMEELWVYWGGTLFFPTVSNLYYTHVHTHINTHTKLQKQTTESGGRDNRSVGFRCRCRYAPVELPLCSCSDISNYAHSP